MQAIFVKRRFLFRISMYQYLARVSKISFISMRYNALYLKAFIPMRYNALHLKAFIPMRYNALHSKAFIPMRYNALHLFQCAIMRCIYSNAL